MAPPRLFVSGELVRGAVVALDPDDAHHLAGVLRMKAGDRVVLMAAGVAWDAELTSVATRGAAARVVERSADRGGELRLSIAVLQALTKGAKFDDVVEKCVELGAARIVPVRCERSYADASAARIERWRRIARSAAQQSRRVVVPEVSSPVAWRDAIRAVRSPLLVAWEGAPAGSFASVVGGLDDPRTVAIAVGPEGSFTDEEIDEARRVGASFVSLGPTILRTETAAAAFVAAIASLRGCW